MNSSSAPPVFLLSSERSGSNLLRKLLTEHQSIYYGPPPAHFLKHLYFTEPYYGNSYPPINREGFRRLIGDALELCYVHFSPWTIEFNIDDVFNRYIAKYTAYSSIYLADFLMTEYAKSVGYKTYFCKDNDLFKFSFEILNFLPDAKFIYLYRDPRDVVLSQRKRTLQTDSLRRISKLWRDEQKNCLACLGNLPEGQIYCLSYENLINKPDEEIERLCEFLEVEFCERTAEAPIITGKDRVNTSKEWQNLSKPVIKNNMNKFQSEFSDIQIRSIENVCLPQMIVLGYKRVGKGNKVNLGYKIYDELILHLWSVIRRRLFRSKRDRWQRNRAAVLMKIRSRQLG